jgi:hypothetical protein
MIYLFNTEVQKIILLRKKMKFITLTRTYPGTASHYFNADLIFYFHELTEEQKKHFAGNSWVTISDIGFPTEETVDEIFSKMGVEKPNS